MNSVNNNLKNINSKSNKINISNNFKSNISRKKPFLSIHGFKNGSISKNNSGYNNYNII